MTRIRASRYPTRSAKHAAKQVRKIDSVDVEEELVQKGLCSAGKARGMSAFTLDFGMDKSEGGGVSDNVDKK
jgi:hypothetical protein